MTYLCFYYPFSLVAPFVVTPWFSYLSHQHGRHLRPKIFKSSARSFFFWSKCMPQMWYVPIAIVQPPRLKKYKKHFSVGCETPKNVNASSGHFGRKSGNENPAHGTLSGGLASGGHWTLNIERPPSGLLISPSSSSSSSLFFIIFHFFFGIFLSFVIRLRPGIYSTFFQVKSSRLV